MSICGQDTGTIDAFSFSKQVKPGFTNYQPHPSILGPEVKQKQGGKGEGSRKREKNQNFRHSDFFLNFFEILENLENVKILKGQKSKMLQELNVPSRTFQPIP